MSSGFVPAGASNGDAPSAAAEWDTAQRDVEARQARRRQEANQSDGKSLYEVLQANKAAKQEAFEEAAKLKNQFRALDDDEVDFLDAVLESTRAREHAVQQETTKHLQAFRQQREQADKAAELGADADADPDGLAPAEGEEQWAGRKRKKASERAGLKGVKLRKSSSSHHDARQTLPNAKPVAEPAVPTPAAAVRRTVKEPAQEPADADKGRPAVSQQPGSPSKPAESATAVFAKSTAPASTATTTNNRPGVGLGLGLAAYSDSDSD